MPRTWSSLRPLLRACSRTRGGRPGSASTSVTLFGLRCLAEVELQQRPGVAGGRRSARDVLRAVDVPECDVLDGRRQGRGVDREDLADRQVAFTVADGRARNEEVSGEYGHRGRVEVLRTGRR